MRSSPFFAALAFAVTMSLSSFASADEPEPVALPPPRAVPSKGVPLMLAGGGVFAFGYILDLAALGSCKFNCAGMDLLAIPVAGYPLYLADDSRRAEARRKADADRTARARGDGCANSAIGCDTGGTLHDIGSVIAWIPTIIQAAGVVTFAYGWVTTIREVTADAKKPPPPPVATWRPQTCSIPGGATLGVVGTF